MPAITDMRDSCGRNVLRKIHRPTTHKLLFCLCLVVVCALYLHGLEYRAMLEVQYSKQNKIEEYASFKDAINYCFDYVFRKPASISMTRIKQMLHINEKATGCIQDARQTRDHVFTNVTLFTTMHMNRQKLNIFANTLWLWPALSSDIRVVLYVDEAAFCLSPVSELLKARGWRVHWVPSVHQDIRLPTVKSLYLHTIKYYNSFYYIYANADILFDETLLENVYALKPSIEQEPETLIIGCRRNYRVTSNVDLHSIAQIEAILTMAEVYRPDAIDYFITTRVTFPWDELPEFVVGRAGYDNWLAAYALDNNITVVDATGTLMALHQTGPGGNKESKQASDAQFNVHLLGHFHNNLGSSACAAVVTERADSGNIRAANRGRELCGRSVFRWRVKRKKFKYLMEE